MLLNILCNFFTFQVPRDLPDPPTPQAQMCVYKWTLDNRLSYFSKMKECEEVMEKIEKHLECTSTSTARKGNNGMEDIEPHAATMQLGRDLRGG
ncbi:Protein Abhd12B [Manis pentadactyla]|nr:Protein Abhd12B [Manis pentadactyla]